MSALPLIEAVQRAGGAITLQGDRLRLSAPEPLPENLLQEIRTHKAEVIDHLQHAGAPEAWVVEIARLRGMRSPRNYPEHAWQQLIVDAERFLDGWAQQAVALGWHDWEVFGCHKRAPWGRIQGMGLVLLLRGDEIAALTETEAVIRTRTGARQAYRRQPRDPLHPTERCLVWELS
jgi:hypothetical protein